MTHRSKCLLYLTATAMLWSMSGVIIKSVDWNPMAIASGRSLVAMLTIAFLARRTLDWRPPAGRQWSVSICLALVSIFFVVATKLTTAANAILLQYTAPVWVAIIAPLVLRERTSGRDWFFILITFGGIALFFLDSLSPEGFWGIIVALLSSLAFAGLAVSVRYAKGRQPMKSMVYGNLLVFLAGLLFWRPPYPSLAGFGLIVFAGVFQYGLAYYLYTLASEGLSSLEIALITTLELILNPLWVFLIIGEKPAFWALIGGGIVLITITFWTLLKTRQASPALKAAS